MSLATVIHFFCGRKLMGGVLLSGMVCGISAGALLFLTRDLPQIQSLEDFKPSAITRVFSADHVLLAELYIENRERFSLAQIPAALKTALITTEDRQFYEHSGIALRGILRAAVKDLIRGRLSEGASTLTQQLAKILFLTPRKSFVRKIREAILAMQLERRYTKDELLTLYLNQIYFGSGAYGAASAAHIYFNKRLEDLNLAECALLAGLPQAPSRFSPLVNPDAALKRRNIVLKVMRTTGAIDQAAYQTAVETPFIPPVNPREGKQAPYFVAYVKDLLEQTFGDNQTYKGGLTVYTTLDSRLQAAAETAVAQGLARLDIRMQHNGFANPSPQAALVAIDIKTGGIVSMVGGRNPLHSDFNRAIMSLRQPGSAFKPFVYALAIERGFTQNDTLLDAPVVYENSGRQADWQPQNYSETYNGEISLRWALAYSKNVPAVRLIEKLGPSSVVAFAQKSGIQTPLSPTLSLALGTSETRLIDLTAAYTVFADQGLYKSPFAIAEVRNDAGKVIWRAKPEQRIAMSRASAAIMTDMLTAVIQEGTGQPARLLPGPLAGKTGTTNNCKDALFIGYAPAVAAGVWVGNDNASTLGPQETGARAALPIWVDFMQAALSNREPAYFDFPDDVHRMIVHHKTGIRLPSRTSEAVEVLVR